MTVSSDSNLYETGSEWRRWDPHIHAPGTLLSDSFEGDWNGFLKKVNEEPAAEALGITDYFCIETYREAKRRWAQGEFHGVTLVFPNVEMRLDIQTSQGRGINIHLLFSPDDPNHENEILRILARLEWHYEGKPYPCTLAGLASLGRAYNKKQHNEAAAIKEGANQFKTKLSDLKNLFWSDKWMQRNCLVAVSVKSGDGTSGLQGDASFVTARTEIERFAHIIFSSNPTQRDFWLGQKAGFNRDYIEDKYRFLKPCLHGSDAHTTARVTPDLDRFCWIKGDAVFETLRQAVLEPEERVWLGDAAPLHRMPSISISSISTQDAAWFTNSEIKLNTGLIAIVGARGSGKTALADLIARAARSIDWSDKDSFLRRASSPVDYLGKAAAFLTWSDGEKKGEWLHRQTEKYEEEHSSGPGDVCYLSQHFVEQLCSSEGLATELREEMERVIFDATDPVDKLETDSFGELAEASLAPTRSRRDDLRNSISLASASIVKEDALIARLADLRTQADQLRKKIETDTKALTTLLPKGSQERAKRLADLEAACTYVEGLVETLRRRHQVLTNLGQEVSHRIQSIQPQRLARLREDFKDAGLTDQQWSLFGETFVGDVFMVLEDAKKQLGQATELAMNGDPAKKFDPTTPLREWPLSRLRGQRDKAKKEVGIDAAKQQKYDLLQRAIADQTISLRRLDAEIKNAASASQRRKDLITARRSTYSDIFQTFVEEQTILEGLYAPLQRDLSDQAGVLSKLQFSVNRYVDLGSWEKAGERLFDLRKLAFVKKGPNQNATQEYAEDSEEEPASRGHGALRHLAEELLLQSWLYGSANDVASAMDHFREKFGKEMIKAIPNDVEDRSEWGQQLAEWLYDTSHILIDYGIEYEGTAIEQLSPGTRGIVLLLLYLAIDVRDRRPLIIDQPEENLDPNSVFEELVPHFRRARHRRQIIIVTHNANLVVNTDADQVILADAVRPLEGGLPTISYRSGSIENASIRRAVCDTLEGGERAFLEREKRYRLRWDDEATQ